MNRWTVCLAARTAQDVEDILDWTFVQFGPFKLEAYTNVINGALDTINAGPQLIDVRRCPELGDDIATLHVGRQGHKGRHQLVFRVDEVNCLIEILRVALEHAESGRFDDHRDQRVARGMAKLARERAY